MDYDKEKFAKRLKEIRASKRLTQDEVSEKTGIDTPNYSRFETGKTIPTLQSLYKIIQGLEVSPNEIFEYEHFSDEKELDKMVMNVYQKFSLKQKYSIYKIFRAIEELQN